MSDPAIEASDMVGYIPDDPDAYHYGIRVASEALAPIRELHERTERWLPYDGADFSYDTKAEAESWDGEALVFYVCAECARIESGVDDIGPDYNESLWPCATARLVYSSEELGEC